MSALQRISVPELAAVDDAAAVITEPLSGGFGTIASFYSGECEVKISIILASQFRSQDHQSYVR